jgi:choice-of-anchor B domain-containing protein
MRIILFLVSIIIFNNINAQVYPSLNINMLAHLDPETDISGSDNRKYSGCWGWYQSAKNKEYAIVGTSSKTYFIDVTSPTTPVICDSVLAKHTGCTWREIKTYQNYCYMVSDQCMPNSFQIVDMQYLPDSVHIVHNDNTIFEICHTIFVDQDKLYCGSVKNSSAMGSAYSTMRVYSLANPESPTLIRNLEADVPTNVIDVVHDMYVRNDTIYASCGYKGFFILKLTASNTFSVIQSYANYPYAGYNHSSWQTDDRKTMVFADEVSAGLPAKVIDVSNLNNITLSDTIRSNFGDTPHNPYIIGNRWCWMSSYIDGLYLYDISNPTNTTIYGYFDTYPQHGTNDNVYNPPYRGNWGAYPFLPSKIIIACDMQNGVFILDGDNTYKSTTNVATTVKPTSQFNIFPNPTSDELNIIIANKVNVMLQCQIMDMTGKLVYDEQIKINRTLFKTNINTKHLKSGCYTVLLKGENFNETKKIIIEH